ncbi:MAG: sigma-70 family RNA polymerase sigma factor [Candidatus Limivicinus sp.]|nr:sigma-70 family RNA polymerase sigma factor [Clostridiales bacterium]MDY6132263.1 sigma-70 family RNA polymerase sigma factor [Candidatus Limivicinus sp.]
MSLSDALDVDGDGSGLSIMDVVAQEDDMAERIGNAELCQELLRSIETSLTKREAKIIRLRYGLDGAAPMTQKETAQLCGISRSYVSRIEKKALEKLRLSLGESGCL